MKTVIKKLIISFLSSLPIKKTIVFESNPDFSCNTNPVFIKILNNENFKKWRFVWFCKKKDSKIKHNRVKCICGNGLFAKLAKIYYNYTAKCLISCNAIIFKKRKEQLAIFLSHGSKTKKTKGICEIGSDIDYVAVQSHFFDDIICYEYNLKPEQLVYLGYPRNDALFHAVDEINTIIGLPVNSHYFVWLPTFRKSHTANRTDASSCYDNLGMPLIYSLDMLSELNAFLVENNLFIIFKPHPAQDVSSLRASTMSNVLVIDDEFLLNKGIQLYDLISKSSALITDYSSVFYDYLLLDKPIGTTTDDLGDWKNGRGFAFNIEELYNKATVRIATAKELFDFLKEVQTGNDSLFEPRKEIKELTNMYLDGNSAERVVSFVIEKLGL